MNKILNFFTIKFLGKLINLSLLSFVLIMAFRFACEEDKNDEGLLFF